MPTDPSSPASVYRSTKDRIVELVRHADDDSVAVPACPEWTVKDLVAHLSGLAENWRSGRLDGYGSELWTAAHIEDRRTREVDWILDEWDANAAAIEPAMADPQSFGLPTYMPLIVITDLVSHEHDLRHAIQQPGARTSEAVRLGLQSLIGGLRLGFASTDLPTMRVHAVGWRDWLVGHNDPEVSVGGDPFGLFRTLSGRRTRREAGRLDWNGDSTSVIDALVQHPFGWRETSLHE